MKKNRRIDEVFLASRLTLAAFAGAISYLAYPRPGLWPIIFVSVALIFVSVRGATLPRAFVVGFTAGFTFFASQCWWISQYLGPLPLVALSFLQALFVAAGLTVFEAVRRRVQHEWVQALLFASLWTAREWVSTHWPYGGFPWSRLAMSQADSPLSGWVYFGGLSLLTFAMALMAALAVVYLPKLFKTQTRMPALRVLAAALGLLFLVPALVPSTQGEGEKYRVAGIQGNANAGLFANSVRGSILGKHLKVTEDLLKQKVDGVKLVVWPENASDINPLNDPAIANRLDRLVSQQLNVPLIFGTITSDNNDIYNSSLIWKPGQGITDQYDKKRPVPFAEFVPDRDFWYPLAPDLIGLITHGYTFGTRDPIFEADSHRFGVLICFEIAVDEIAQSIVDSGAEAIISQTNNADFGHSDEAFQQIAIAKLRSIETGLPLINVSTTGPSGAFSGSGKTLNLVTAFEPHAFVADLPLRKSDTPAMGLGRYFDVFNVMACAILVLILEWRKKRRSA
ncbi:MAG: hypothetical protein RL719_334 [Actinomycetota bacterium]